MRALKKFGSVFCLIATIFCAIEVITTIVLFISHPIPAMAVTFLFFVLCTWLFYRGYRKLRIPKEKKPCSPRKQKSQPNGSIDPSEWFTITTTIEDDLTPEQKRSLDVALAKKRNSTNPVFHRSEQEEELEFQFFNKWGNTIGPMGEAFEDAYREAFSISDPDKQVAKYYEALELFHKAKKFCYGKGKGGQIYFQDTWECMHNSRNDCFSYEDLIKDGIAAAEDLQYVVPKILHIISKGKGQLLQKDIYELISDMSRGEVQSLLRRLEKENKIIRVKKGSTYILSINQEEIS